MLLAVFIYWGWESALNLSEETEDSSSAPGIAGLSSTVILLATYVLVGITVLAVGGVDKVDNFADNPGILGNIAGTVLGPLAFIVTLSIIVSGLASAQTTIIPSSRTSLSMAHAGALPKAFARVNPRFKTPEFSTIVVGVIATAWYVGGSIASQNFLSDSLNALSLAIAFYYMLTGIACVVYWRHHLMDSVKNFLFIAAAPLLGAAGLGFLLVESAIRLADPGSLEHRELGAGRRDAARDRDRLCARWRGADVLLVGLRQPRVLQATRLRGRAARDCRRERDDRRAAAALTAGTRAARLNSLRHLSAYDDIAKLPISVESYELEANDREYSPEFTRGSTIIHLKGGGEEGIGEDVVMPSSTTSPIATPGLSTTCPARRRSASYARSSARSTCSRVLHPNATARGTIAGGPSRAPPWTSPSARRASRCGRRSTGSSRPSTSCARLA